MSRLMMILLAVGMAAGAYAQNPQPKLTYEERGGTAGRSLVVDGKTFGPYKEITLATRSNSGVSGLFFANKRDKTYVVAQGKEWGPLDAGYNVDVSFISDDGKLWAVSVVQTVESEYQEGDGESEDEYDDYSGSTTQTILWVNGKSYGPYQSLYDFQYAETGGSWIAHVQADEYQNIVLLNGKVLGTYASVEHIWMFPDGKDWGYLASDDDSTTIYTAAKTYSDLVSYDFNSMYPKSAHWGYSIRVSEDQEIIVIDGKTYPGYVNFYGLYLSTSGRHWAFEAEKRSDAGDHPVIVVNGKEFLGEGLSTGSLGDKEYFFWDVKDGTKVSTQVYTLP